MAKKRAPRGTGTIYRRPDRSDWAGQITINGHRHTVYDNTKTGARAKINLLLKSGGETSKKVAGVSVAKAVTEWLADDMPARDLAPG
jgi:hypothetical protein